MNEDTGKWLGSKDACKHYGVSKPTLYKMAKAGTIRFLKTTGGHYRFAPDKLQTEVKDGSN